MDVEALVAEVRADPARRDELLPLLHEGHPALRRPRRVGGAADPRLGDGGVRDGRPAARGRPGGARDAAHRARPVRRRGRRPRRPRSRFPDPDLAKALAEALVGMRGRDDSVSFAGIRPQWPDPESTTALTEVLRALRALGSAAHDVHGDLVEARRLHAATWSPAVRAELDAAIEATARAPLSLTEVAPSPYRSPVPAGSQDVGSVVLEDQAGRRTTFGELFRGRRHVVAFFYTRCGNPAKCSATVTRLAQLAARLPEALPDETVGVVGISYDPGYDTPERLAAYGAARGMAYSDAVRLLRAPTGHAVLREHFDLTVGYAGSLVNQHGVELYLVGDDARTHHAWTRVTWTVDEVLDVLTG